VTARAGEPPPPPSQPPTPKISLFAAEVEILKATSWVFDILPCLWTLLKCRSHQESSSSFATARTRNGIALQNGTAALGSRQ